MPWEELQNIIDENIRQREAEAAQPPIACPVDGELLEIQPQTGVRNCPLGNFRWDG